MTRVLGTVLILSLVGAVSSWLAVNDFVALDDGTTKKFVLAAVLVLTGVAAFAIHKRAGGRAAACVGVGALAAGAVLGWWALAIGVSVLLHPPGN